MTEAEKKAALDELDQLPAERMLGHDGQQSSYPSFLERMKYRRWIRASGDSGLAGGTITRGVAGREDD